MPGGVYDPNLDKEKDDESAPQIASGGTLIGGSQEAPQSQEKGSGRFQNLQDYLSANQGNQFGNQFAGKVAGDIEGSQQKIAQAGQDFGQLAASGNKNPGYDQSKVSSALAAPEQAAQNQATMDYFSGLRNASYGGPKSLVETPDIYGKAYAAEKEGEAKGHAAGSEGGRFALLNQYFGRPGYSQGERNLDQYLVSNDQGAQSSLKQAQENAKQLAAQFGNVQSQAADKASQYGQAAEQARGNIQNALGINAKGEYDASKGGALNSQLGQMQANLSAQQAAAPQRYQALYDFYNNGRNPSSEDLQQLGLNPGESKNPNNLSRYTDYLSAAEGPKSIGQVSTPQEQARLKALEQLAGLNPNLIDYGATPYDINKYFNFDKDRFRSDNAAAAHNAQLAAEQAAIEQARLRDAASAKAAADLAAAQQQQLEQHPSGIMPVESSVPVTSSVAEVPVNPALPAGTRIDGTAQGPVTTSPNQVAVQAPVLNAPEQKVNTNPVQVVPATKVVTPSGTLKVPKGTRFLR